MDKLRRKAELLADKMELPADAAAGTTKLTLYGRKKLLVENHRGIVSYGENELRLDCTGSTLLIRGDGLSVEAMDARDMLISGRILSLEFM